MSDALDRFLSIGGLTTKNSTAIRSDNMAIEGFRGIPPNKQEAEIIEECGERLSESTEFVEQKCARFLPTPSITLIYGPPGRGKSY